MKDSMGYTVLLMISIFHIYVLPLPNVNILLAAEAEEWKEISNASQEILLNGLLN